MPLNPDQFHRHTGLGGDGPKISYDDLVDIPQFGIAQLVSGTVTVLNGYIDTNSVVQLSVNGMSGTPGFIYEDTPNRIINTSFIIKSTSTSDSSTIGWRIINL